MDSKLYDMLKSSAEADKAKALLSLEYLGEKGAGVGDHSTKDLWTDAEEALALLESAESRLECLEKHFKK